LSQNPNDAEALLAITAMAICRTGKFKDGAWSHLYSMKLVSWEWIVFAAMFMEMTGADCSSDLAEFANATKLSGEIIPYFETVASHGGQFLAEWATEVLALLSKPPR